MAISRKPTGTTTEGLPKETAINALINKGGSIATNGEKQGSEKAIIVRIPNEAVAKIDSIVSSKQIKIPRHTWLLEAVFEKLEREI